ncbi:MAG TPA: leucyl aminopeptidase [Gemmatimonadaceae bacterium]|nr:leucyl aminopeptidase [Gemmatimonadaceae bacterium]
MPLTISARAANPATLNTPLLVALLPTGTELPTHLKALDKAVGGAIGRTLRRGDFRGGRDEVLHLTGGSRGPRRVLLVGYGTPTDRPLALRRAATLAARQAHRLGAGSLALLAGAVDAREAEQVLVGLQLGCWEFTDLRTPPPEADRRAPLTEATLIADNAKALGSVVDNAIAIGAGYDLSRRLAQMPGNLCTPDLLADTARDIGTRHSLKVTVLGRKEMERAKMGSFLGVAQGTPQDPKLVAIEYRGGPKGEKPIVLVGKGLCFDTGGISIKPAERMEFMKFDMCGAAGVIGAMEAIARLALPVNVVGVFGATTNMPSGTALKPGDVVTASNGKSIEIINTDAEGRLVLADVLSWVTRFDPAVVVDAATLTGAVVVALGNFTSGALGNDDALVAEVVGAARRASEPAWQLPMSDDYRELIRSDVADIKNTGGRAAGTITAAMFLREFVSYPWVHLDVAGTAYSESDLTIIPKGPTGVPTGTFIEFVRGRAH